MPDLLMEYANKFNENFPTFLFMGIEEEMEEIIKKCIKENKPYKFKDTDKNISY